MRPEGGAPNTGVDASEPCTSGRTEEPNNSQRPINRAMRRRAARLQAAVEASCASDIALRPTASRPPDRGQEGSAGVGLDGSERTSFPLPAADAGGAAERDAAAAQGAGAGDALRRLETHVWHARRMAMERRWGHVLPAHAPGRARGSRSLLATLRGGCLLHDASYMGCLELRGHQRQLAELLRRVSDPRRLDAQLDRSEVISGAAEWQLFLHRPGAFPAGPLAPARALWLTVHDEDDCCSEAPAAAAAAAVPGEGMDWQAAGGSSRAPRAAEATIDEEGWATRCALWLWVHAAAFADARQALCEAAQGGGAAAAAATPSTGPSLTACSRGGGGEHGGLVSTPEVLHVTIRSRCSDLRRIEVVGARASAALARVLHPLALHPVTVRPDGGGPGAAAGPGPAALSAEPPGCGDADLGGKVWRSAWHHSHVASAGAPEAADGGDAAGLRWRWPAGAVVGFEAADPRLASPVKVGCVSADAFATAPRAGAATQGGGGDTAGAEQALPRSPDMLSSGLLLQQLRRWPEAGDWTAGAAALWRTSRSMPVSAHRSATGSTADPTGNVRVSVPVPPPMSEAEVGLVRRAARQQLLFAGSGGDSIGGTDGGGGGGASVPNNCGVSFPMLLVRRAAGSGGGQRSGKGRAQAGGGGEDALGWSVVLPARWVLPVWLQLAFTGARPTGQHEWRQLATHARTPCFPYDHPYTPAGQRYVRERLGELVAAASKRPLGRARVVDASPLADWRRLAQTCDLNFLQGLPQPLRGRPPRKSAPRGPALRDSAEASAGPVSGPSGSATMCPTQAQAHVPAAASEDEVAGLESGVAQLGDWMLALDERICDSAPGLLAGGHGPAAGQVQPAGAARHRVNRSCLHGWTLRKAVCLGLVPTAANRNHDGLPPSSSRPEPGHTANHTGRSRCLVHVLLRVIGPGVCHAGAEIIAPRAAGAWAVLPRYSPPDHRNSAEQPGGLPDPSCAPRPLFEEEHGDSGVIAGYVTSPAPRGSPQYPGGLGVCDASCLLRLFAGGNSECFHVWVRNPVSNALRRCSALILWEQQLGPSQLAWA